MKMEHAKATPSRSSRAALRSNLGHPSLSYRRILIRQPVSAIVGLSGALPKHGALPRIERVVAG